MKRTNIWYPLVICVVLCCVVWCGVVWCGVVLCCMMNGIALTNLLMKKESDHCSHRPSVSPPDPLRPVDRYGYKDKLVRV